MTTAEGEKIAVSDMSEAEESATFGDDDADGSVGEKIVAKLSDEAVEGVPEFASLPPGFVIPPGKRCGWLLFRAEWTDAPQNGDRWCMMWPLSESEEKIAYKRSGGDSTRAIAELTKMSIRLIDGVKADRTGATGPGNVNIFWAEIGTKLRQMLQNYYLRTHTLSQEEQTDFFRELLRRNGGRGWVDHPWETPDPDVIRESLIKLNIGSTGTQVDAYWHLLIIIDPDAVLRGRAKQKAMLARYGRQSWFAWEHREINEMNEAMEAIAELVEEENSGGSGGASLADK